MPRYNYLAAQFYLATGTELNLVNHGGTVDFAVTAQMPYGLGVQTWTSRWNPDGSFTFLGQSFA